MPKSSVTKFAGDNLEKAKKKAEKLQKEKERLEEKKKKLEEKKEKLEKQKKKIEKAKKAMEEAKKLKEDAEKKIQEGKDMVNDVKSQVDEAKQMAADAQAAVNDAKATAQGAIADAKSTVGEVKSTVNDAKSTVGDAVGTVREEKNELQSAIGGQSGSAAADSSFVDDYVAQYEAGINSDAKIYEQMPAADSEAVSETLPAAGDVPLNRQMKPKQLLRLLPETCRLWLPRKICRRSSLLPRLPAQLRRSPAENNSIAVRSAAKI